MINVYIGVDSEELVAYTVLAYSIMKNSSRPVRITPIFKDNIKDVYTRKRDPLASTEFSFSRFLTPYLSNYEGWSIFMDCDMLFLGDIAELWDMQNSSYNVMVCKHEYIPKQHIKFNNQVNTQYGCKNWSSLMMFNNSKCKNLTPEAVNHSTGLTLHQFIWVPNRNLIGEIPLEWNWLVGEYPCAEGVKNVHYTNGGPYFKDYVDCDYSSVWQQYYEEATQINL